MLSERKRYNEESLIALGMTAQMGKSPSFSDLQSAQYTFSSVHFHLMATVNGETDCMLVPSVEGCGPLQRPLCVHWLNNKELDFTVGAERVLTEVIHSDGHSVRKSPTASPIELAEGAIWHNSEYSESGDWTSSVLDKIYSETTSSKDALDVKLEVLLRQWSKSSDILFAIHPIDGSLLIW
ncbi:unnamed protein product [Haemonchus placei]|uniref:Putative_PNPOx domain-containing protein n=1 Tax=Haemonchus placei TaxID=6290 RepID=A0A0N4VTX2_HAEPC|nr:unnamed protein product [Haemonchus placei]